MIMREYQKRVRALLAEKEDKGNSVDVKCFAVTPGLAFTSIVPGVPAPLTPVVYFLSRSPRVGVQSILKAALDTTDLKGGEYLSK